MARTYPRSPSPLLTPDEPELKPNSRSFADRGTQAAEADSLSARWQAAGPHPVPADGEAPEWVADTLPADGEALGPRRPGAARRDGRRLLAATREGEGGGGALAADAGGRGAVDERPVESPERRWHPIRVHFDCPVLIVRFRPRPVQRFRASGAINVTKLTITAFHVAQDLMRSYDLLTHDLTIRPSLQIATP